MKDRIIDKVQRYRGEAGNEILTTNMVADYLHCHVTTVYRLVKEGRIPHFKLGGDLRFQREAIAEWIEKGGGSKTDRLQAARSQFGSRPNRYTSGRERRL